MTQERGKLEEALRRAGLSDEVELFVDDQPPGGGRRRLMRVLTRWVLPLAHVALIVVAIFLFMAEETSLIALLVVCGLACLLAKLMYRLTLVAHAASVECLQARDQDGSGRRLLVIGSTSMIERVLERYLQQSSDGHQAIRGRLLVDTKADGVEGRSVYLTQVPRRLVFGSIVATIALVGLGPWLLDKLDGEGSSDKYFLFSIEVFLVLVCFCPLLFAGSSMLTLRARSLVREQVANSPIWIMLGMRPATDRVSVDLSASPIVLNIRDGWANMEGVCGTTPAKVTLQSKRKILRSMNAEATMWAQLLRASTNADDARGAGASAAAM
jgi:hypothetical protein